MKSKDDMKIRGMCRLRIVNEDGTIAGDSGWKRNQIVNGGVQDFLSALLGNTTGSKQVTHLALGTGGAPASDATTLGGEVEKRKGVTVTVSESTSVVFTATFGSSDSFVTDTQNISNIGLFNSSAAGGMFAGAALAGSSSCATNQQVNASYTITFTR